MYRFGGTSTRAYTRTQARVAADKLRLPLHSTRGIDVSLGPAARRRELGGRVAVQHYKGQHISSYTKTSSWTCSVSLLIDCDYPCTACGFMYVYVCMYRFGGTSTRAYTRTQARVAADILRLPLHSTRAINVSLGPAAGRRELGGRVAVQHYKGQHISTATRKQVPDPVQCRC